MAGLTPLEAKNAKAGRHADGKGPYLLVKASGAKSWVLRVQVGGRRGDYGLGSLDLVPLAEARDQGAAERRPISGARSEKRPSFGLTLGRLAEAVSGRRDGLFLV